MSSEMKRAERPAVLVIDHPLGPPKKNIVSAGCVDVWGFAPDGMRTVRTRVYRASDDPATIPPTPPDPAVDPGVKEDSVVAHGFYRTDAVPNVQDDSTGTACDNRVVVWATADAVPTPASHWDRIDKTFCGQEETVTRDLSAHACLWFASAPAGFHGPYGEDDGYRPLETTVPDDAKSVRIRAVGGPLAWRHNPADNRASGPDGLPVTTPNSLVGSDLHYQSPAFNSQNILPLTAQLNTLVGLWQAKGQPLAGGPQIVIGSGPATIDVEAEPKDKLFLGFHDGYEWSNNSGGVTVTVEWILIDP